MLKFDLPTPAVVIDYDIAERNVLRTARLASAHGKKLRPHIKTHKMVRLAQLQMKAGAVGICAAKVSEAEIMADGGIPDILIANEIVGSDKLARLVALASRANISVLVDSHEVLDMLCSAISGSTATIGVYVELELGDKRCGTDFSTALELVKRITETPNLRFRGIETFGGFLFHGGSKEEEIEHCKDLTAALQEFKRLVEKDGIEVPEVSVGGSPSLPFLLDLDIITEVRPGVYIFNDAATVSRGAATYDDCALSVVVTVISISRDRSYAVVDGGAKTFSYCCPGVVFGNRILHGVLKGQHDVCLSSLSEEHGIVDISNYEGKDRLRVGDKLEIIPSHTCPVVNLTDYVYLTKGDSVFEKIPVDGRGKVE